MQHRTPSSSFVAPRARLSRPTWFALLGLVAFAFGGVIARAPSAHAAPPVLTTPLSWTGPAEAQVANNVILKVNYGAQNAPNATITITAPPDTYIQSVSNDPDSQGVTWSVTYNRVPNSDPWQTSATLTGTSPTGSFAGTLSVAVTSRNGGFLNGQLVSFGADITASNGDGTASGSATHGLRLLSAPSVAPIGTGLQETYYGIYDGQLGTFKTTSFMVRETGNGRADVGTTATFTLPNQAQFIAAIPGASWTLGTIPTPGASGTVNATYGQARGIADKLSATGTLGALLVNRMDTTPIGVTYFVPCGALQGGSQAVATFSITAYQAGTSAAYDLTATNSVSATLKADSCNTGSVGKSLTVGGIIAVPGEVLSYYLTATTPATTGPYATNVVMVDRLPAAVTYDDASLAPSPFSSSFQLYLCAAASLPGTFDFATFDTLRNATTSGEHCRTSASFLTTATPDDVTHVVAYAAEWKDPSYTDDEYGVRPARLLIDAKVNADISSGSYVNRMCVHGASNGAATPWSDDFAPSYSSCLASGLPTVPTGCSQACFSMTNSSLPGLALTITNADNIGSPLIYNRGEIAEIYLVPSSLQNANLLFDPTAPNNTLRLQLPAGFDVLSTEQLNPCTPDLVVGGPEFSATLTPNVAGTLVTFVPQQLLSVSRCGSSTGSTALYGFKIRARVNSTYPFIDGAFYPATASFNVSNSSTTPTELRNLQVIAPSVLEPDIFGTTCTQAEIGATASFTNTGGQTLTNVLVDVPVPTGATFASLGVPEFHDIATLQSITTNYEVSYLVAGSYQSSAPSNLEQVEGVRLTMANVAPYVQGDWQVLFTATLSQANYTFTVSVDDDQGHATTKSQVFATTGCPCTVDIDKSFVPDGGAATAMAGVQFVLDGPFGYSVTHTTDAAGNIHVDDLAPGSYTLTEVPPVELGGAAIAAPFSGSWSTTFTLEAQATVNIDATNACSCPDEPCVNEGVCDWDAATKTASCSSTPVTCGTGACGEVCDVSLDQCVAAEPAPCDQPGGRLIWGNVTLSDGTEKLFKCIVTSAGAPPTCEADPDTGMLILYEIEAGTCAE